MWSTFRAPGLDSLPDLGAHSHVRHSQLLWAHTETKRAKQKDDKVGASLGYTLKEKLCISLPCKVQLEIVLSSLIVGAEEARTHRSLPTRTSSESRENQ